MNTATIVVATVAGGIFAGLFWAVREVLRFLAGVEQEVRNIQRTFVPPGTNPPGGGIKLEGRIEELELRFTRLVEHVDERTETAAKLWRRIRAAQRADEERDEQLEEPREPRNGDHLPLFDGGGGEEEGMLPLHHGMGEDDSMALAVNRAICMRIAGGL